MAIGKNQAESGSDDQLWFLLDFKTSSNFHSNIWHVYEYFFNH